MSKMKCVVCGGDSKVRWTRNGENDNIIRKYQCEKCGNYFLTEEKFLRMTEQTVRNLGQPVTTRERGPNVKGAIGDLDNVPKDVKGLNAFCDWLKESQKDKVEIKEKQVGLRSGAWDEILQSKPVDWDAAERRTQEWLKKHGGEKQ